jgi:hypothetical protein
VEKKELRKNRERARNKRDSGKEGIEKGQRKGKE